MRAPKLMAVLAHPDDESLGVGGTLAKYASEGVEVYLVTATRGERGRFRGHHLDDSRHPGPSALGAIREKELHAAAAVLGLREVSILDYHDSQLDCANPQEAVALIAGHIRRIQPDVVVTFGPDGAYGHPDHVKVHHVVRRAVDLAARRPRLLESTFNRDIMRSYFVAAREAGVGSDDWNPDSPQDDGNPLGTPEAEIQWQVDVSEYLAQRRASMEAHRSQATDIEAFLAMPPEVFAGFFGREHYLEPGLDGAADGGSGSMRRGWPFGE